ncbi:hypothetical protein TW95_gp0281 [Pandoravirus inopinatum]|uniref:Uncharacterized protein n=1 Tax=Pandoravirus inopinatum TaxID=1605721 RepID=A0A0B5J5Q8_9VIRU|nr:hypothetical protein TW95_gp0281 [Pandoravirus inopinatum]AJF97015.1 hypothetical protein [Pandoravirus inopinatum]
MEDDGDQHVMQVEIVDDGDDTVDGVECQANGDGDNGNSNVDDDAQNSIDDGSAEDDDCDCDDILFDEAMTHAVLDVEAEEAVLVTLCHWAREGLLTPEQGVELARLKAGDILDGVRLADISPAHGSHTDGRLVMRYARMWSHLADSRACIAFLSSRVDAWPPTLADVEQAYRDLDDAYRERCRTHDGDDDNDNNEEGEENAGQSLIAYLIDDARAGDPYPGDMLADALDQALQRMATGTMSQRWPQYRDPFAGRSVPRHVHGSGCVSSTAEGDLDYYVVVAHRSDTVEAVLLAVTKGSGACAVARCFAAPRSAMRLHRGLDAGRRRRPVLQCAPLCVLAAGLFRRHRHGLAHRTTTCRRRGRIDGQRRRGIGRGHHQRHTARGG